jgi:glycosyltransferase involved in cell wall biosynthesis
MRNEAGYIQRCLASIFAQTYPADRLEIWVLDGRSSDDSWPIVAQLFAGRPQCHVVTNPGITQTAGWRLGLEHATGDVIGIVSAHAELAPDFVWQAVETLQRTGADLVGGPMRAEGEGRVGQAVALATSTPFGVGGARFHYTGREEEVDTVYMGVCWREMYHRVGGVDAEMVRNQDDELSYRLLERGGRIVCNPAIRSRYYNRGSFRALWRQYFQYGYWKVRVMRKHPHQMRPRQFIPPLFVAALWGSALLAGVSPVGRALLALVAGSYALANLTASVRTAHRGGWRHLPLLPLAFTVLHLSYGLGFVKGLANFGVDSGSARAHARRDPERIDA